MSSHRRVPFMNAVGRRLAAVAALVAVTAGACGSTTKTDKTAQAASATKTPTTAGSSLRGPLTVFAAASLTESFTAESDALRSAAPDLRVALSFAGSPALVQQIVQGAPADVFASADTKNMQKLVDAGLVESPRIFAHNKLEIAVAPGNPKHITGLKDLARPDVSVVLEDPSVPAGRYAEQALTKAGVTVKPKSSELDVKSALTKVTGGEADATIVYVTDVRAAKGKAIGVVVPDAYNVVADYPIAVVKASKHRGAAEAFVDDIVAGGGRKVLVDHGFLPA